MRGREPVVVGAFAVLLLAGCGSGGSSDGAGHTPGGTAVTAVDHTPFACPDPDDRTPVGGADTLPTGATAALMCFRDNHVPWVPPRGVLRQGLDSVVRVVNAQRVHVASTAEGCSGVGAPAWSMVLRYADGTRTISGDNGGCWSLAVGSTQRFGSKRVFHAYLGALLRQRSGTTPPQSDRPPPTCPDRAEYSQGYSPIARVGRVTAAVVCRLGRGPHRTIRLTPAQLATLRHDFATAATRRTRLRGPSDCHALEPRVSGAVVGVDRWGDPFTVLTTCDTYRAVQPARDRFLFARMLPATARLLGRLLAS